MTSLTESQKESVAAKIKQLEGSLSGYYMDDISTLHTIKCLKNKLGTEPACDIDNGECFSCGG